MRAYTERELQKQNHDYMEKFRRETLLEKSFYHLTEDEIRKMREVVERLAQKIKNILSIRRRRLKRGKLDLHQTLRRNMSHGGIPFELVFKQRKKDRPKLVILCDISSSVANVSRFMLQFVYSLQEAFTKIRAFVFVAELGEVTHVLQEGEIGQAIEKVLEGGDVINVYTRSNFGHAFHHFWQNFLSAIDNKTTVLILGDARNNYNDPRAWCLRDIHNKAKNVVWLNPESPSAWGFGDSVMDKYLPYTRHRRGMPQPAPAQRRWSTGWCSDLPRAERAGRTPLHDRDCRNENAPLARPSGAFVKGRAVDR